ncbi:unnamed protein product [Pleuronectes platessa]|uniref:Uncharacterized protein n=1 Tax=Pleuronectes platessa TaxID=8262 RepID=A0A9N7YJA0_PLEPL|nr:unnamed protein product [Pleuronectes platessa]
MALLTWQDRKLPNKSLPNMQPCKMQQTAWDRCQPPPAASRRRRGCSITASITLTAQWKANVNAQESSSILQGLSPQRIWIDVKSSSQMDREQIKQQMSIGEVSEGCIWRHTVTTRRI